jgi:hypothetical protein
LREDVKRILLASVAWSSIRLDMYCESKMWWSVLPWCCVWLGFIRCCFGE